MKSSAADDPNLERAVPRQRVCRCARLATSAYGGFGEALQGEQP